MNLSRIEKYRARHPFLWEQKKGDDFGWFEIPTKPNGPKICIQVSPGDEAEGWEHASISLAHRCPTWDEMCMVKDLIWDDTDTVVQFHPPKKDYVNFAKNCLHLWCWRGGEIPRPPSELVGPK